ncbi:hypothetical protein EG329_006318 [Mollisiaceae sp. DMI_Dod_QoI]|nr:hypothetical protein EG329_006318 [Helotiales sp. DMI_Dod_QoI]
MRKTPPPQDFKIHVDPSCLSDSVETDTAMSAERIPSNESSQTVVHHDSWNEEVKHDVPATNGQAIGDDIKDDIREEEKENSPPPTDTEVKATLKEPELETVDENQGDKPVEDEREPEISIAEDDKEREARERRMERIEAEIQAAARAVVANIQHDHYDGNEDSVLSAQTDESYDREETELRREGTGTMDAEDNEESFISDHDAPSERHSDHEGGDSSSHHGDVDDDVFSSSDRSKRSSMDSLQSSDNHQKVLTSPMVGEEAASANEGEPMSRIPSVASYIHTPTTVADHTPSKVLSRPPFRTPSSVRALQMSSPTASLFSSPRSTKRHLPTVSRIGTPNSHYSPSKRTPTRLKPRKAAPLVLLHVTVLPLQWPYSYLMSSSDVPESLQHVKESWRLLQDKIGDTVLERGILLSHPQESYEVLEERLYEALELPVRPRARILKCGHYMGPLDSETPSSDEEGDYFEGADIRDGRKWCDICGRDVRVEEVGDVPRGEKRFTVKIYASNGLMRAGAWEAAWREMERVDVELEPFVDTNLRAELEHLAVITPREAQVEQEEDHDDGFVDEEVVEHVHDHSNDQEKQIQDARAREKEEMIARLAKEDEMKQRIVEEDEMRKRMAEEEEIKNLMAEEEELKRRMAEEDAMRQHMDEQEAMRQNEERMREIYGQEPDRPQSARRTSSRSSVHDDSSFAELLLAAFKVVLRDSRNVAIGILSVLVLLLALSSKTTIEPPLSLVMDNVSTPQVTTTQVTTTVFKEAPVTSLEIIQPTSEQVLQFASKATEPEAISQVTTTVIREYTVTEKVPAATSTEISEVLSSTTESVSVSQVTTTVFRERTVTELVPAPTSADIVVDPCEPVTTKKHQLPVVEAEIVKDDDFPTEQDPPVEEPLHNSQTEVTVEVDAENSNLDEPALTEEEDIPEVAPEDLPSVKEPPTLHDEPVQKYFGPHIESTVEADVTEQELDNTDNTEIDSATEEA